MSTTRLDQFDNSDYRPGPWLARALWVFVSGLFFQTWFPWPSALKRTLLSLFGANIGRGVVLKPRVTIKYPWKLTVGDHTWIGENVWIDNLGQVTIGNHCCLSQGALLLCGNHNYKNKEVCTNWRCTSKSASARIVAGSSGVRGSVARSSSEFASTSSSSEMSMMPTTYQPSGWCKGCKKPRKECFRKFDWACPQCGNHNWARKQVGRG